MLKTGLSLSTLIWLFFPLSIQAQPGGGPPQGTATVSGIVTLEGKPVGQAIVELLHPRLGRAYSYPGITDANGRFHIPHVAAGEYRISAQAPAHISPGADGMRRGLPLVVAEGENLKEVALKIERGGAIAGKITDAQGKPVIEAEIDLYRLDENGNPQLYYLGYFGEKFHGGHRTDDRGSYRLYGLPEGGYLLCNRPLVTRSVVYPRLCYPNATSESKARVIEVALGSEADDIDIILPDPTRRQTARERSGEVTVRLVTEDGIGLPDVSVHLSPVTEDGQWIAGVTSGVYENTDESGSFTMNRSWLGEATFYSISVSNAKGYVPDLPPIPGIGGLSYLCRGLGDRITITMIKGAVITGKVTTAEGEPVSGAHIGVEMVRDGKGGPVGRRETEFPVWTDDRGVYRLYGLAPGTYAVFTRYNLTGRIATYGATYGESVSTYHPSSRRETATSVAVSSGGESSGIDIRYRGDRGRIR
jgi:DNA-binding transcriptional ArsR family regulator